MPTRICKLSVDGGRSHGVELISESTVSQRVIKRPFSLEIPEEFAKVPIPELHPVCWLRIFESRVQGICRVNKFPLWYAVSSGSMVWNVGYKERLDLVCGGQAAWAPWDVVSFFSTGAEVGETLRNIISMSLFKDVASRVKKKSQYIWQTSKHPRVVKNKLAVTFCMKLWSCKNKKRNGKARRGDRPSVGGERTGGWYTKDLLKKKKIGQFNMTIKTPWHDMLFKTRACIFIHSPFNKSYLVSSASVSK